MPHARELRDVEFSSVESFVAELLACARDSDRETPPMVRIDTEVDDSENGFTRIWLRSGFLEAGSLKELKLYCGEDYQGVSTDGSDAASFAYGLIEAAVQKVGSQLAGGQYVKE